MEYDVWMYVCTLSDRNNKYVTCRTLQPVLFFMACMNSIPPFSVSRDWIGFETVLVLHTEYGCY